MNNALPTNDFADAVNDRNEKRGKPKDCNTDSLLHEVNGQVAFHSVKMRVRTATIQDDICLRERAPEKVLCKMTAQFLKTELTNRLLAEFKKLVEPVITWYQR